MSEIFSNPIFGIAISLFFYVISSALHNRFKSILLNPMLVTVIMVVLTLKIFDIPFEAYQKGGAFITMFLAPATAALAYSIYQQIKILKTYAIPILIGCTAGSLASIASIYACAKFFGLDDALTASMLPKSVTLAISLELSKEMGGLPPVTTLMVSVTGLLGGLLAPTLVRIFHVSDPVAAGIAIGSSSHGVGTARALEMGKIEGATSGIAMGVCGLVTTIAVMLLMV